MLMNRKTNRKPKHPKHPTYPCVNCGFKTNGDFMCRCGNVLCESCSGNDCMPCRDRKENEEDARYERWRERFFD